MPEPIVVRVTATPDPDDATKLNLTVEPELVRLSLEDGDEIRWVCDDGNSDIVFASVNNPFDPNASTGGIYQTQPGGSQLSGTLDAEVFPPTDADLFKQFKYSVVVRTIDGSRQGSIDPRVMGRRRRVYLD